MKKNKFSKNWVKEQERDIYFRKSKIEGYRSRAVYKLKEIDEKFKILKNGISLIDLGASPGGWSQYAATRVKNTKILSIDIKNFDEIKNVNQIIGDFREVKYQDKIKKFFNSKVDVVLSDMASNTTGNKNLDSIQTGELCIEALEFSKKILKINGKFVSKMFMGSIFTDIKKKSIEIFKEVYIFKPEASRKNSKESFIICKNLR